MESISPKYRNIILFGFPLFLELVVKSLFILDECESVKISGEVFL